MKRGLFVPLAAGLLVLLFVCVHTIARLGLSDWRIDTSQDKLFSISAETRAILRDLKQPMEAELYLSRQALADDPIMRAHGERVRDMLQLYAAASGGLLEVHERDPAAFSPVEDAALKAGLTPIPGPLPDDPPAYLGLVLKNVAGRNLVLPILDPAAAGNLEYDLSRAINQLERPQRTRISLITGLPWLVRTDPITGQTRPVARMVASWMDTADLTALAPDFRAIPERTDVLIIAQPNPLTPEQQFAIDQYVLAGGRVLLFLDPASMVAQDGGGGPRSATEALGPLMSAWGFAVQGDVIADRAYALPVETQISGRKAIAPQPLIFQIPPSGLNQQDAVTAGLPRGIHIATPGQILALGQGKAQITALLTTSQDTMRLDATRALSGLSPQDVELDWQSARQAEMIAARITGQWTTAFPSGNPANPTSGFTKVSAKPGEIIVFGDVDLLADSLYLGPDGEAADNARLIQNCLDVLTGQTRLLSIRARSPTPRPLVVVEKLRQAAQTRILEEQQVLESRLALAEARLADIEARAAARDALSQSLGTREIDQARQEVLATRARLRAVQEGVRQDVAGLKNQLIGICAALVPFVVLLVGLIVHLRRRPRRKLVGS